MKKATFISLLLFITVFSINAQPITTTSPNDDDKNAPIITFEKMIHVFMHPWFSFLEFIFKFAFSGK